RMSRQFREQVGYFQTRLAILLEFKRRSHQLSVGSLHKLEQQVFRLEAGGKRLTVEFLEFRFRVERIQLARPARHVQKNDLRGGCRKVTGTRSERPGGIWNAGLRGRERIRGEQLPQSQ